MMIKSVVDNFLCLIVNNEIMSPCEYLCITGYENL